MGDKLRMVMHQGKEAAIMRVIGDYADKHFAHKTQPLLVTIEDKPKKRTSAQNRYFWPLCQQIADAISAETESSFNKQDIHDRLLMERYGYVEKAIAGMVVPQLPKTSEMPMDQMRDLIEWSLAWAAERGFTVMMPADYATWAKQAA